MSVSTNVKADRMVAIWLLAMCVMVFVMVVLGGTTRLTGSGLSMVDWRPITGWLPPFTDAEWQRLFDAYKAFPEFHKVNAHMDVEAFKGIFWLEYLHRLWGRLIGVAFALPLLWFAVKGWIGRALLVRLVLFLVLGAAQGVLGWYMVQSGLVDDPSVSPYRLTAHLALAVAIYAAMLWTALDLFADDARTMPVGLRRLSLLILGWVALTIVSGGFVAGLDAGLTYNTFPLMDGKWVPDGLGTMSPWFVNAFENVTTVQFEHRLLAEALVVLALVAWVWAVRSELDDSLRRGFHVLAAAVVVQAGLGVATLLLVVPVPLAAIHQAGAMVVLTAALWLAHRGRSRAPGKS